MAVAAETTSSASVDTLKSNLAGIGFVCLGVAVFAVQDVILKALSGDYPISQMLLIRSVVALPLLVAWLMVRQPDLKLATHRPMLNLLRCVLNFLAFFSFYLAVAAMPLAEAVAIAFSAPIIITVISALVLKEPVGVRRWAGIAVGFIGMLLVTQPGTSVFNPAALLALVCALAYGSAQVLARILGNDHTGGQMALYSAIFYLTGAALLSGVLGGGAFASDADPSLAFLTRPWVAPSPLDLSLMAATGVVSSIGFVALAQAYRLGEPSAVAPFEYTGLIWALFYGALIWGEWPDETAGMGMLMIVGAGLYVLLREHIRGRPILLRRGRLRPRSGL